MAKSFDDMASLVEKRKTELESAAKQQEMANKILDALNSHDRTTGLVGRIPLLLKEYTRIEAVGIRLRAGEDFPYVETDGFPGDFVEAGRSLFARNGQNDIVRDGCGKAHLECLCGAVIAGRTGPPTHFFTKAGSFWTNSMTELMASASPEDLRGPTRDLCRSAGYESVALIPLRSGDETVGLLQLNDRLKDRFDIGFIEFLEGVAASIGMALSRKEAEEAVKRSEATLKSVLSASPVGIALCRNDRTVDWINDRLTAMTGYALEEVKGKVPAFLYASSDEFHRIEEELFSPIRLGAVGTAETKWIRKDGTLHDVHVRGAAIDSQDMSAGIVFTAADITEQKRADELLRESEERYRIAIENSNDGIVLARKDELIFVNRRFLEISGYDSEEEVMHLDSSMLVHPADRERVSMLAEMRMGGKPVPSRYEFRGVRKDGTERDMEANVASLLYRGDRVSLVHFRDITEHKRAEELLRESENKFKDLSEKAIVGVFLAQDGVFKYVNSRFAEVHGYEVGELIDRKGYQDMVVPEDLPGLQENLGRLLSGEADLLRAQEFRLRTKQGETKNVEIHGTYTMYRGKKALIGTLLDVTERKAAEDALRWKTAFLEALLEVSPDGILVIDGEGKEYPPESAHRRPMENPAGGRRPQPRGRWNVGSSRPECGERPGQVQPAGLAPLLPSTRIRSQ